MKSIKTVTETGNDFAKHAALMAATAALVVAAVGTSPAAAHGKNNLNLKKYCSQLFKLHKRPIARKVNGIDYFYSRKKRSWVCRMSFPHFQRGRDTVIRKFRVEDACRWQYKTHRVHYHHGHNVKSRRAIHCGVRNGMVHKPVRRDTRLTLCNRSDVGKIYAAYAYWEPKRRHGRGGWSATGWYRIRHNDCRTVTVGRNGYKGSVYLFAEGGGSKWVGTDARFCVNDTDGFKIRRADSRPCHRANHKRVRMTEFRVRPGRNRYNFGK